jgi:hypothetical protein
VVGIKGREHDVSVKRIRMTVTPLLADGGLAVRFIFGSGLAAVVEVAAGVVVVVAAAGVVAGVVVVAVAAGEVAAEARQRQDLYTEQDQPESPTTGRTRKHRYRYAAPDQ